MALHHPNGSPVVEIYVDKATGYDDPSKQGATFAFNVLRSDGSYVSWLDVEKMANTAGVYIRAGGQ
jgi:molybdenum cofactor sulfurtransferase